MQSTLCIQVDPGDAGLAVGRLETAIPAQGGPHGNAAAVPRGEAQNEYLLPITNLQLPNILASAVQKTRGQMTPHGAFRSWSGVRRTKGVFIVFALAACGQHGIILWGPPRAPWTGWCPGPGQMERAVETLCS